MLEGIGFVVDVQDIDVLQSILNFFLLTEVKISFSVFVKPNNAGIVHVLELELVLEWNFHQDDFRDPDWLIIVLIFSDCVTYHDESEEGEQ